MVQATARHLLVSSEEQCQELKQQILEGADFAQIARAHHLLAHQVPKAVNWVHSVLV